ncbi:Uncharacterized membrane protein [Clostridium cavendishii DSM 21758]|uniref:Uncharacterized membrane protein n=1 Tax=Clostridium cavendishii DSM 21758 TaxID=1121302 RepID=A0A1M6NAP8_9CLOT|nr:DUF1361 domain-containing protein [Clostridium cavendishii]SHJ92820.1 Uncharacterized membrane protein [Clostridium cavendishii DSM 21758]
MNLSKSEKAYRHIFEIIGIYLFLSFSGCVMLLFRKIIFGSIGYKFLIWNLFLAWIPLIFSIIIGYTYAFYKQNIFRKIYLLILGVVWVVFYPNSPYIVTDFIHLSGIEYYFRNLGYSMNFILWYDFIMIALFILTGFLLGFISLYMIQMLLIDKFNKCIGWLFVVFIMFLSSFGIYLGRFVRWNSWDIVVKPTTVINSIFGSSKNYAIEFTISFGFFLILIYFALYYLTNMNQYKVLFHRVRNK